MFKLLKRQEGFTLIELMVVVLIIGILVAIAIPVFTSTQNNAKKRACFANERTIEGSIQQYNAEQIDHGGPTITTANWAAQLTTAITSGGQTYGPWLKTEPKCPSQGTYTVSAALGAGTVTCDVHAHF